MERTESMQQRTESCNKVQSISGPGQLKPAALGPVVLRKTASKRSKAFRIVWTSKSRGPGNCTEILGLQVFQVSVTVKQKSELYDFSQIELVPAPDLRVNFWLISFHHEVLWLPVDLFEIGMQVTIPYNSSDTYPESSSYGIIFQDHFPVPAGFSHGFSRIEFTLQ